MRSFQNSKAVLSAPPSFLAAVAQCGLFRLKLIVGDPWKAIVEIEFRHEPKLDVDWTSKLPLYDSK